MNHPTTDLTRSTIDQPDLTPRPIVQDGWMQLPYANLVLEPSRRNTSVHIIHGVLTILTVGLWLPIWITYAITAKRRTFRIRLDRDGQPTVENLY